MRNARIDFSLRECPFCGNPAEIYEAEPFSFMPDKPTEGIRCCNEWCIGHTIKLRYGPDSDMESARAVWNIRKRKNKNIWRRKR